ncbi:hypothetical protein HPP92_014911 [Vanilla planifolia]|uniref:Uncharacterized protein n=1 Tax=Vanilla planifolia TaxID=51239 RepID=A0A835QNJ0_VANPL|nr:hypothetical protein HPP92_014911 [Vanilla planifolia]
MYLGSNPDFCLESGAFVLLSSFFDSISTNHGDGSEIDGKKRASRRWTSYLKDKMKQLETEGDLPLARVMIGDEEDTLATLQTSKPKVKSLSSRKMKEA